MRSFPSDLTITASALSVLEALEQALQGRTGALSTNGARGSSRDRRELHAQWRDEAEQAGRGNKNTLAWLNHCLREVVDRDTIVVSEYSFRQEHCPLETPGSLFAVSSAGGLGWGFGASLGAKLAAPERQVLSVLGDGAYMFANPTACHYVAQMQNLPVLTVIYNNALYGAVRRATLDMFGSGVAAQGDGRLLADLPAPNFEKIVAAHDGHGERVERPGRSAGRIASRRGGGARRTAGAGERDLPALMRRLATRVLVVGGGPVGTTLAMDLAWRGIDVIVAEQRHRGELPSVKCNHVAARTMEIFRRLGVAQRVRDAGLPHDHANDVAFRTTTTGIEFARIPIPVPARSLHGEGRAGWMVADAGTAASDQSDLPGAAAGRLCRGDAGIALSEPRQGARLHSDRGRGDRGSAGPGHRRDAADHRRLSDRLRRTIVGDPASDRCAADR